MAEELKKAATAKKAAAPKKAPAKKAAPKATKPVEAKKAEKPAKKAEPVTPAKPKVTEALCIAYNVRTTPRKMRLVCDLVRGKDVDEALGMLSMLNKAASTPVAKAIKSAAANATNNFGMDKDKLYVAEIQASDGFRIKRYLPRAKGSASGLIKRNSNLRVIVKERQ